MIDNHITYQGDRHIDDMRAAFEHRAAWFALLIDEARKRGLDISFARDAIMRCGCFHAHTKYPEGNEIKPFAEAFLNANVVKIFEMEPTCVDEHEMKVNFHYCPLVAAWQKLGFSEEDIAVFCDIAMDGDRGIVKEFPEFEFELGKTIAKGDSICEITVRKKK